MDFFEYKKQFDEWASNKAGSQYLPSEPIVNSLVTECYGTFSRSSRLEKPMLEQPIHELHGNVSRMGLIAFQNATVGNTLFGFTIKSDDELTRLVSLFRVLAS